MGIPPIFRENAWEVYTHIVARFKQMDAYADLEEWEIDVNLLDGDDHALKPPSGLELYYMRLIKMETTTWEMLIMERDLVSVHIRSHTWLN